MRPSKQSRWFEKSGGNLFGAKDWKAKFLRWDLRVGPSSFAIYWQTKTNTIIGYLNHHKLTYPDKAQLLESVNNYMTAFANKEASEARSLARQRQVADADGFITVTRGGRTNPARQEVAQEQAEKQKEKQRGLEDFYRFQSREKRKQRAAELVRKFEEDKEKVRKMKERRGRFRVGPHDHSFRFLIEG